VVAFALRVRWPALAADCAPASVAGRAAAAAVWPRSDGRSLARRGAPPEAPSRAAMRLALERCGRVRGRFESTPAESRSLPAGLRRSFSSLIAHIIAHTAVARTTAASQVVRDALAWACQVLLARTIGAPSS
jgi:hypothetical protein